MTFFYDRFEFEQGSRLTGIWVWPWPGDPGVDNVALVSQVRLGAGQDGSLECDFLSSHLPWAAGGVHGVGPEGDPWLVVVQMAPRAAAGELVASMPEELRAIVTSVGVDTATGTLTVLISDHLSVRLGDVSNLADKLARLLAQVRTGLDEVCELDVSTAEIGVVKCVA